MATSRSFSLHRRAAQSRLCGARHGVCLLFLALTLSCSEASSTEEQGTPDAPDSNGTTATVVPVERMTQAPVVTGLDELDPASSDLIRAALAALNENVEEAERWSELGVVLHAHRRFELAGTCYEQRLLRDENDARTWYYLALVHDQLGRNDRAESALEQCREREPRFPPVLWRLGYALLGRGELARAEECMRAALAIAPEDAASNVGLARVLLQSNENEAAVALLEAHTRRMPSDENARYLLGTAYRKVGRMEDAARSLATGSGADPIREDPWEAELYSHRKGYRTEYLRAVRLLDSGQVPRAIELLEGLRERQPDDLYVQLSLHRGYRKVGQLDRALEVLLDVRESKPQLDMVHLHLAGAWRDKARLGREVPDPALLGLALESSQRACALSPTYAPAHAMLGDVLADLGLAGQALEAWSRAASLDRNSSLWQEKAGRGLSEAGRWSEAVEFLRRLDELEPNSARTLFYLGAALANTGQLEDAIVKLERAAELAPGEARVSVALENTREALRAAHEGSEKE